MGSWQGLTFESTDAKNLLGPSSVASQPDPDFGETGRQGPLPSAGALTPSCPSSRPSVYRSLSWGGGRGMKNSPLFYQF